MGQYDRDFHAWAHAQSDAVRRRSTGEIDWDNVAEELEGLGKQQASELKSRYVVLIAHLLKWTLHPERRGNSWRTTILEQRARIADHVEENPSLKALDEDVFERAYKVARLRAAREMKHAPEGVPVLPPFTPEQASAEDFWPE